MEILEIRSSHDLTTNLVDTRPAGAHSYKISTRHFATLQRDWQRSGPERGPSLPVMTLAFERIWMTETEVKQVVEAIRTTHTPIEVD